MKEQKAERQGLATERRDPADVPRTPQRPGSMIQPDVQMRKTRGRLSRHVQNKLGETLHAMFDEIVREGVPERFAKLLDQIEENRDLHGVRVGAHGEAFAGDLDAGGRNPDPLLRGQRSEDKGSS